MSSADDATLALARRRLNAAVLYEAMDEVGLSGQMMDRRVRPVVPGVILCGRARTGNYRDVYHADERSDFYDLVLAFVSSLQPGEVPVLACGRSGRIHPWGGSHATAAALYGAAGCVTDGVVRDVAQLRELGLPCFSMGIGAVRLRGRGRLIATDVPVQCGGVWVSPGDLIYGDGDGVVVGPRSMEAAVLHTALRRADAHAEMIRELRAGVSLAEVYRRHGRI